MDHTIAGYVRRKVLEDFSVRPDVPDPRIEEFVAEAAEDVRRRWHLTGMETASDIKASIVDTKLPWYQRAALLDLARDLRISVLEQTVLELMRGEFAAHENRIDLLESRFDALNEIAVAGTLLELFELAKFLVSESLAADHRLSIHMIHSAISALYGVNFINGFDQTFEVDLRGWLLTFPPELLAGLLETAEGMVANRERLSRLRVKSETEALRREKAFRDFLLPLVVQS